MEDLLMGGGAGGLLTALVMALIHKYKTRVDVDADKERSAIRDQSTPLEAMAKQLASMQDHNRLIIENHLEHDREDRDRLIEVLVETKEAMRAIQHEITSHRQEEMDRIGKVHGRLNECAESLARLERRQSN